MKKALLTLTSMAIAVVAAMATSGTADARNRSEGIRLRVRLVRNSGVVAIRWQANRAVRRRAEEYVFQYWTGEEWSSFLYTSQGSDRGHPVHAQLPGEGPSFCFRMIAVGAGSDDEYDDEGPIVGRGTSGNEGPCA